MDLFYHDVGLKGADRDFPKTVFGSVPIDEVGRHAPYHLRTEMVDTLAALFPSGTFNCWGVPAGAAAVIKQLDVGDVMLLIRTTGGDGDIPALCAVRAFWKEQMLELSSSLWGSERFPFVFFFDTKRISLTWTDFKSDVGYSDNFRPSGNVYRVKGNRLGAFGGPSGYISQLLGKSSNTYPVAFPSGRIAKSTPTTEFEVGEVYNRRRDLHHKYGGQRRGGMSTPQEHPVIFLFTGEGGSEHGYRDEFKPDGTYHYTGEGQRGDMSFVRANRALRDHRREGKRVHLFEALGAGNVRYIGEATYLGHHHEERPDTDGLPRQAIVFELALEYETPSGNSIVKEPKGSYSSLNFSGKSLQELRRLALSSSGKNASVQERRQNVRVRSEAVRAYVLKRANGTCEGCGEAAPFMTKRRQPYLEPHHTTRIADGGPDHPAHVIALCPTCHRRVHHAHDGEAYNMILIRKLAEIEEAV